MSGFGYIISTCLFVASINCLFFHENCFTIWKKIKYHQPYLLIKHLTKHQSPKKKKTQKTKHCSWAVIRGQRHLSARLLTVLFLMNVQHPPLTRTLEEGGNRPTLNTWDSRDVLSALHKMLYMPECVASTDQSHKHRDLFHHSWTQACCLLFVSVFFRVTPTSRKAVLLASSHIDTKGFHVVSFNCKPFVSSQCCRVYTVNLW